jgi:2-phospho-L-lactate guanylyltransferase
MSALAVVPVKNFDRAKQRLKDEGYSVSRRALVESMLTDVLMALRRAETIDAAIVVTQDRAAERLALAWDAEVVADPDEASHSAAAAIGIKEAQRRGARSVLIVAGDCPALLQGEVDALLRRHVGRPGVVVIPDRHGTGTNALLLTPPDAIVPAFGPGSCERHVSIANAAGVPVEVVEVPSLAIDIDTVADLEALKAAFADHTGGAAHTRGMLTRTL